MDPERWQRIQQAFQAAVECPAAEWPAILDQACGGDEALRREVEDLLRTDAEAGTFIERAVAEEAAALDRRELVATERLSPTATVETVATVIADRRLRPGEPRSGKPHSGGRFGKYEIEAKVGQGGFGVVYRGRDPVLRRTVAIKTCSSPDAGLRRRFFREGRIAAGLQHPNVTTVHDFGVEEGLPYLVQEFLTGEDLDEMIERRTELDLGAKLDVLLQIARGLEYAHRAGVLHRDVKPANVRVTQRPLGGRGGHMQRPLGGRGGPLQSGAVKIMDFGIAKLRGTTRLTDTGMAMGTVGYLAPEQLRGEELDERADVFSFGVLAYELLAFERPFQGDDFSQVSYQLLYVEPPAVEELAPDCPPALGAVVRRCLAKDPRERYGDFTRVIADLEPLTERLRTGVDPATWEPPAAGAPEPERHGRSRRRWPVAAAALAAMLVLALVAGWSLRPRAGDGTAVGTAAVGSGAGTSETGTSGAGTPTAGTPVATAPVEVRPQIAEALPPADGDPPTTDDDPPTAMAADSAERPTERPPASRVPPAATAAVPASMPPPPRSDAGSERGSPARDSSAGPDAEPGAGSPAVAAARPPVVIPPPADERLPEPTEPTEPAVDPGAVGDSGASIPSATGETPAPEPAMRRGDLITPGPGVMPPRLIERPEPRYPPRARRRQREARVIVRVLVDETGRVQQAVVPRRDLFGFHQSARAAALGARYEPATRGGVAGKMWTELPFEFRVK